MTKSVFSGTFSETILTYTVDTEGALDANDLWVEGGPVTKTVRAIIATPRAPNLQVQIGADVVAVEFEGALSNPRQPPTDFFTGTEVSFVMDGRQVKGRVLVFAPSPIPSLDVFGRPIQIGGVS